MLCLTELELNDAPFCDTFSLRVIVYDPV